MYALTEEEKVAGKYWYRIMKMWIPQWQDARSTGAPSPSRDFDVLVTDRGLRRLAKDTGVSFPDLRRFRAILFGDAAENTLPPQVLAEISYRVAVGSLSSTSKRAYEEAVADGSFEERLMRAAGAQAHIIGCTVDQYIAMFKLANERRLQLEH
jgi:uncharacterized Zn finger protein